MDFMQMMDHLFTLTRAFPGSYVNVQQEGPDGNYNLVVTLPVSDTNGELYKQAQQMFEPID